MSPQWRSNAWLIAMGTIVVLLAILVLVEVAEYQRTSDASREYEQAIQRLLR